MSIPDETDPWTVDEVCQARLDASEEEPGAGGDSSGYYPENLSMLRAELIVRCRRFAELREQYLLGFGYQTARAYWGDLESFQEWCTTNDVDLLAPNTQDVQSYLNELLGQEYSPNTVARRRVTLRALYKMLVDDCVLPENPVSKDIRPIRRRTGSHPT